LAVLPGKPEGLLLDRKKRKCFIFPEGLFKYDGAEERLGRRVDGWREGLKVRDKG